MTLPSIPTWTAIHPLVVHFPIALLLVAPLFVVLGLAARRLGRPFLLAALVLMTLGTVASYVAVASGEAAKDATPHAAALESAIHQHEELAEATRTAFTVITVVFAAFLFLPGLLKRGLRPIAANVFLVVFLLGYAVAAGVLANAAHAGGELVHTHGMHAALDVATDPVQPPLNRDHDDD